MPTCKRCSKHFSRRVVIDNKEHILNNRKYCLECSPFGNHNTRTLHKDEASATGRQCTCSVCGKQYLLIPYDTKGHTKTKCGSCCVNVRRFALKKRSVEYKGGKCHKCGYDKYLGAMEFHHVSGEKEFSISSKHCYSWEHIKQELDKCILLCSNCHREIHGGVQ